MGKLLSLASLLLVALVGFTSLSLADLSTISDFPFSFSESAHPRYPFSRQPGSERGDRLCECASLLYLRSLGSHWRLRLLCEFRLHHEADSCESVTCGAAQL